MPVVRDYELEKRAKGRRPRSDENFISPAAGPARQRINSAEGLSNMIEQIGGDAPSCLLVEEELDPVSKHQTERQNGAETGISRGDFLRLLAGPKKDKKAKKDKKSEIAPRKQLDNKVDYVRGISSDLRGTIAYHDVDYSIFLASSYRGLVKKPSATDKQKIVEKNRVKNNEKNKVGMIENTESHKGAVANHAHHDMDFSVFLASSDGELVNEPLTTDEKKSEKIKKENEVKKTKKMSSYVVADEPEVEKTRAMDYRGFAVRAEACAQVDAPVARRIKPGKVRRALQLFEAAFGSRSPSRV